MIKVKHCRACHDRGYVIEIGYSTVKKTCHYCKGKKLDPNTTIYNDKHYYYESLCGCIYVIDSWISDGIGNLSLLSNWVKEHYELETDCYRKAVEKWIRPVYLPKSRLYAK